MCNINCDKLLNGDIEEMGLGPDQPLSTTIDSVPAFLCDFLKMVKLDECVLQDPNKRRMILTFVVKDKVLAQMDARHQSRDEKTSPFGSSRPTAASATAMPRPQCLYVIEPRGSSRKCAARD